MARIALIWATRKKSISKQIKAEKRKLYGRQKKNVIKSGEYSAQKFKVGVQELQVPLQTNTEWVSKK